MPSRIQRVEVYRKVFVSKKDLDAHEKRLRQELEANAHPEEVMSPREEEEWDIARKTRKDAKKIVR
jgi:hypothetical protein